MKRLLTFLTLFMVSSCVAVMAADTIEGPKDCESCGMDRAMFVRSRMLIIFVDGARTGTCSIRCAAEYMLQNGKRQVKALMVADYVTRELIDARSATWVIGGSKKGVMSAVAKWAFAGAEEAKGFVRENGGELADFDRAMKTASEEVLKEAAEAEDVNRELHREMQQ